MKFLSVKTTSLSSLLHLALAVGWKYNSTLAQIAETNHFFEPRNARILKENAREDEELLRATGDRCMRNSQCSSGICDGRMFGGSCQDNCTQRRQTGESCFFNRQCCSQKCEGESGFSLFDRKCQEGTFGGGGGSSGDGRVTGNPDGNAAIPPEAAEVDTSSSLSIKTVIGDGTPESCTSDALISAVAQVGGTITFDCGNNPVVIEMKQTAQVYNDVPNLDIVIDGGGLVTLSGMNQRRILYMNTCDPDLTWTTSHCDNQDHPRLVLQNLDFIDGNSANDPAAPEEGGGAIYARGGRFKVVNCRFFNNRCVETGPDVGGGAIRVFDQYENLPVYVTTSTFGGSEEGKGNFGSNGGATNSIGVSWVFLNCLLEGNRALGKGGYSGTPGGGNGGAIYMDGKTVNLTVDGCLITNNEAGEFGGGIFVASTSGTGNEVIKDSTLRNNPGRQLPEYPGVYMWLVEPTIINSVLE